jgi:anti-anti-sigma regulatory factor
MNVATMAMRFQVEQERITSIVQEAAQKLEKTDVDLVLDFSSVSRLDTSSVEALEELAQLAENRGAEIVLREVNIDVYKVLKLIGLTTKFEFTAKTTDGTES